MHVHSGRGEILNSAKSVTLARRDFGALLSGLRDRGYDILGPRLNQDCIGIGRIESESDLPIGLTDEHAPGRYRVLRREDQRLFGYVVGQDSWKRFLSPPNVRLMTITRSNGKMRIAHEPPNVRKIAFLGVRSCDLYAIRILDRVMLEGPYRDEGYRMRRENVFIVAIDCSEAKACCFCVSMGTGPKAESGFDIALTEVLDGERHYFVLRAGSEPGQWLLDQLPVHPSTDQELDAAQAEVSRAAAQMGRSLDTRELPSRLRENYLHPRWDQVAKRCLSCGNCTMVCPTCFCTTLEDTTDVAAETAERWKRWDSCFSLDFSYVHGGHVRASVASRYRQWLVHKLSTWHDQFGSSGCVGCGRCIVWCPVGIDITEEATIIASTGKQ